MKNFFNYGIAFRACAFQLPTATRAQEESDSPTRGEHIRIFVRAPAEADLNVLSSTLPLLLKFPQRKNANEIYGNRGGDFVPIE